MNARQILLAWEMFLTFGTSVASGLGLTGTVPSHVAAWVVLLVQSANMATIVGKSGKWAYDSPPGAPSASGPSAPLPVPPPPAG